VSAVTDRVANKATDAARDPERWIAVVGRIGLATQGVLYVVVGLLAQQVASGRNDQADQRGAIEAVADQRFGRLLLLILTIGLALHCCWRLVLAARGGPGEDDAKDVLKRLADLGRGIVYGSFTVIAAKILIEAKNSGRPSGEEQRKAVGTVLDWPGGKVIIVLIGVSVIGAGLWHMSRAVTRNFVDNLDLGRRSERSRVTITALGCIGFVARGAVFCMVGWFLVESALDEDPNHTGGLDQALRRLSDSDHGPGLLRVMAIGLLVFGVYRIIDAWLRIDSAVTNP
jgi:hypothetical protein